MLLSNRPPRLLRLLLLLLMFLTLPPYAYAYQALVVQSLRDKAYDEAFAGFQSACSASSKRLILTELDRPDISRVVREDRPEFILAIGAKALEKVSKIREIPIVYLMVLDPPQPLPENVTGVSMNIPKEKHLRIFRRISPARHKIGLIHGANLAVAQIKTLKATARSAGMELVTREVSSARDVPGALHGFDGNVDAFWMIPDPRLITPETTEAIFLFSQRNSVPVVTFSEKYLSMGAMVSLGIDYFDMGRQAGRMGQKILAGTVTSEIPRADARLSVIRVNQAVARKLGLRLSEETELGSGDNQ